MQFTAPQVYAELLALESLAAHLESLKRGALVSPLATAALSPKALSRGQQAQFCYVGYSCPLEGQLFCQHVLKDLCVSLFSINSM